MAGLDELAAFLVLGNAQRQAIAAEDPYAGGQQMGNTLLQSIMQDTVQRPNAGSSKERIALAALAGLGGGLFGGLSNNYQARAEDAYQDTLANTIMGRQVEKPSVLSSGLFGDAKQRGNLFQIGQALEQRKLQNEIEKLTQVKNAESLNQVGNDVIKGLLSANPKEREAAGNIARTLGLGALAPESPAMAVPVGAPAKRKGLFGDGETIADKLETLTQRYIEAGAAPSAAGDMAARAIEADRIANRAQAKRIEDIRTRLSNFDEIISTARAGVQGAGETGGALGGVRDLASRAYAMVSGDEQKQRDAQALLESISPDIIKLNRSPGAQSDREMAAYLAGGPSTSKTPSENMAILERMEAVRQLEGEYADFLDTYLAERGDLRGADELWQQYKAANPLFIDKDGALAPNTQRQPWTQFDFSGGSQSPAAAPEVTRLGIPEGAMPTGRTAGGKPVYAFPDGRLWVED